MNEDRSSRYHRLRRRATVAGTAWTAALLLLVAATPASAWLRDASCAVVAHLGVPSWFEPPGIVLVYAIVLGLIHEVVSLPILFYRGYLLEHRYGLSVETLGSWTADHVKGGVVSAALGLTAVTALYAVIRRWPVMWWMPAGIGLAAALVVLTHLAPVLLMPLFFHVEPLNRRDLRDRLLTLSRRAGVAVVDACEWRMSNKTRKANAALAGLGRTRRILVSDTLLSTCTDDEIEAVLAHEIGHHVRHDIWKNLASQTAVGLAGFLLASVVLRQLGPSLGWMTPADPAGLPAVLLTTGGLSLLILPLANAWSRRMEWAADRFACHLTGRPDALASAMFRLGLQNLAEERPPRLARWLFHTHPPVADRVAAARAWAERRPASS